MEIISRAEAKAQGLKRYFTGKPCRNGHISERYVSSGGRCVECILTINKRWYEANKERHAENGKRWYEANKEKRLQAGKRWHEANKERAATLGRRWYEKNKEYKSELSKRRYEKNKEHHAELGRRWRAENPERRRMNERRWREENRDRLSERLNRWRRRQRATNPEFRMRESMRDMLKRTISSKTDRTHKLLGYTAQELREHIERQFTDGMSWEAHARGEIHIDHIYPIAQFIRDGETDPAVINALSNLRPMWASENLSKGDRIEMLL